MSQFNKLIKKFILKYLNVLHVVQSLKVKIKFFLLFYYIFFINIF